ncbi:MAG: hypothetical protein Q8L64_05755 [bacterium]|nr:hypothetical protein [bacterium]
MANESISDVLNLRKRKSETPLQTIERYVARHHKYAKAKMTYAGRLDPMAEGVLVVLAGEKNKERDAYTSLDKEYEFEFFLGYETDTFDVLGIAKKVERDPSATVTDTDIQGSLGKYKGTIMQKYPPYSSKVINGEPMFALARSGRLVDKDIPTHEVKTEAVELVGSRQVSTGELLQAIRDSVMPLVGDFRQEETMKRWEELIGSFEGQITVFRARVVCGSGFYVRQLVQDVGNDLGTGAVTLSILRTRVGEYRLADSV